MSSPEPLVSVGIPTYNRSASVERAVRSVLGQDHSDLEVVVADDASPDDTWAALERLAAEDPRVRIHRNDRNLGHAGNFKQVMELARGEYFMWLSDDDWIDPGYVGECLRVLRAEPEHALVAGQAHYHRDGRFEVAERPNSSLERRPLVRVAHYYARVNLNGLLYGLGRHELFAAVPFKHEVGGDWLTVATFAYRGPVRTLTNVHVNRSIAGLSEDPERLARSFGLSGARARHHHLFIGRAILADLLWREPIYRSSPLIARAATGLFCAAAVTLRFGAHKVAGPLGLTALARRVHGLVRS
jgi:glycosyltransferase involved in cell wall biosynthesis